MKKSLLALSLTALLFSCKKETTPEEFTPTDLTGTGWLAGYASKTVITPNGTGGWTNTSRVPAAGVNVTIRVAKSQLYPNSNAQGADVYSGTTDANGYYKIAVKSNGSGVSGNVVIDGFYATQDTLINGVLKPGLWNTWTGLSTARNIFSGQTTTLDHAFNPTNPTSNPNNITIGSAIITGSISMNIVRQNVTVQTGTTGPGSGTVNTTTNVAVPAGHKVYLNFNMDPVILATKMYETTTDASGNYTFNLQTVAAGTAGFSQNATIWLADYSTTRDTMRITTTMSGTTTVGAPTSSTITGPTGVYNGVQTSQNGVFNTEIRNATNMNYNSFIPN